MSRKGERAFARASRIFPQTDSGNAELLVHLYGKRFRYVTSWGRFLVWTGTHWAEDVGGIRVGQLAKKAVRQIRGVKWRKKSESRQSRRAMVDLVREEEGIVIEHTDLDKSPWLLNVANGTIDLRTGKLRPFRRKDLITKLVPVMYSAHADCPDFDQFLLSAMGGDQTLVDYLQRWAGYSFTGSTRDQALIFHYGDGNNGKSTFIKTLQRILGGYATRAARGLLFRSRNERHPTSLANLAGKRFVSCSEIGEDQEFDEELVKDLTGGDSVNARYMRQDEWIYIPIYKLWLAGNDKPRIKSTTHGIWRRMQLVPWEVIVAPKDIDKKLDDKLWMEAPGILNWCIAGCLAWRRNGLLPPKRVLVATDAYRREQNVVGQFFDEVLIFEQDGRITRTELRTRYEEWCKEMGHLPVGARKLNQALRKAHAVEGTIWDKSQSAAVAGWAGVRFIGRVDFIRRRLRDEALSNEERADLEHKLRKAADRDAKRAAKRKTEKDGLH